MVPMWALFAAFFAFGTALVYVTFGGDDFGKGMLYGLVGFGVMVYLLYELDKWMKRG